MDRFKESFYTKEENTDPTDEWQRRDYESDENADEYSDEEIKVKQKLFELMSPWV